MNDSIKQGLANYSVNDGAVIAALRYHGESVRKIARTLGLWDYTVTRALDPQACATVAHGTVLRVRAEVEARLRAAGSTHDFAELWAQYDRVPQRAA